MTHTLNLFGVKLKLSPTIEQGAAAVHVEAAKFGVVMERRTVPAKDIAVAIDAFTTVTQEAEALMRGAGRCARVMSDGKACGLTAPCPDCGMALHDVPEGS
ncbi:MAG: hypothetical protein WAQ08_05800 [Aquabacterium sp.]|uniref:hypothetical protein n=1 Tax=Aquabacterium sp. TaxID=1872578 RepID=UPI003BB1F80F